MSHGAFSEMIALFFFKKNLSFKPQKNQTLNKRVRFILRFILALLHPLKGRLF
jgi:hypothetical protein